MVKKPVVDGLSDDRALGQVLYADRYGHFSRQSTTSVILHQPPSGLPLMLTDETVHLMTDTSGESLKKKGTTIQEMFPTKFKANDCSKYLLYIFGLNKGRKNRNRTMKRKRAHHRTWKHLVGCQARYGQ